MVNAYLYYNGNALEAVNFYADAFHTEKQKVLLFGDVPGDPGFPMTDETKKRVMQTFLVIGGSQVMFSDVPEGMPLTLGDNISLVVGFKDRDDLKNVFEKLRVGGAVRMEMQETFWTKCYGYVVDKFGVGWQLSLEG